jgi:hypothetical protein
MVQQRKIWNKFPDSHSILMHFKSVNHDSCPVQNDPVRATTIISGYFITTDPDSSKSTIRTLSQTDLGGSLPTSMVASFASKAPKEWIEKLRKGLDKIRNEK